MSILRQIGKKHFELATYWLPSLATFGAASSLGLLYITDWKVVLQYVPYYSGKFKTEE
ncbi:Cytochrome b-c1 complex subunit 10 [Zootermopsis nevadensis]|uniref:Cytochrome b-c1 complex subunit 10 n=1 Tax=Zootermopsis nevadensis TaxID=136037 RepID=A0A067QE66_ZOONE|nr:Cytochrome b-c1 complex subunit 10 [Zootermopsis nevadensis]KDR13768.1 Cytochrome b-c1 complex subunit 10 [Zootermopsis nevadensis]